MPVSGNWKLIEIETLKGTAEPQFGGGFQSAELGFGGTSQPKSASRKHERVNYCNPLTTKAVRPNLYVESSIS
jgi:hypothetical protein